MSECTELIMRIYACMCQRHMNRKQVTRDERPGGDQVACSSPRIGASWCGPPYTPWMFFVDNKQKPSTSSLVSKGTLQDEHGNNPKTETNVWIKQRNTSDQAVKHFTINIK